MAPRANWKGFLRLSLVTCPVALYPATSDSEKITFNQLNRNTGNRIRYLKVDAETGDEVESQDIIKGYQVDKGTYVEVTKDELENIALESAHTIDIDEFVPRTEIDNRYFIRPYYIVPDGKVGHDAYAVIRETIRKLDRVALARIVLTNREHVIALEPQGRGLVGMLLRYPYEVRNEAEYFDGIQDVKLTKEMLDLASHIVETKAGHFEPKKFEDHYEAALVDLVNKKRHGETIVAYDAPKPSNVINLMDALRKSLSGEKRGASQKAEAGAEAKAPPKAKAKKARKRAAGQTEMLLPISGKGEGKAAASKKAKAPAKRPAARKSRTTRKAS
ncbi:MAG TPA: Ku protein [Xanthobacteraceae bacterium]|nr:Ku protein [Xanthobacteraceae bacterium]